MKAISNLTSLGLGGAAVFTALLTTLPAAAGEVTACIGPGGAITAAAAGSTPLRKCPPNHVQQTWGLNNEGPPGPPGADGISCWDLDQDGEKDGREDFNKDGTVDVLDCRPAQVDPGVPTDRRWYVSSHALLKLLTPDESSFATNYLGIYPAFTTPFVGLCAPADTDNDQSSCLLEPIDDPCGLWEWNVSGDQWSVRAKDGYNYATYNYLAWDGADYFGWQQCRDVCLGDSQCVGASIEEAEGISEGMVCKLVAKTPAPGYSFRHAFVNTKPAVAYGWGDRDESPQSGAIGAVLSVCPAPAPPAP